MIKVSNRHQNFNSLKTGDVCIRANGNKNEMSGNDEAISFSIWFRYILPLGICIDVKESMNAFPTDTECEETILRIYNRAKNSKVSVIVIFASSTVIRRLVNAALKHASIAPRRFTWIGSDGWGNRIDFVGAEAESALGALTIMIRKGETAQEFKDHFSSFNLTNYPRKNKRFAVVDSFITKKQRG